MRLSLFIVAALLTLSSALQSAEPQALTELYKQSLVYLKISNSAYEQIQPWKQTALSEEDGFGVAVAPDRILTTAENVMYATFVQARAYEQNEWIPARVIVADYECNLCLLELDKDALAAPLKPVTFKELFPKGRQLTTLWLAGGGDLTFARSYLDRAEMEASAVSFTKNLSFILSNTSRAFGDGEICLDDADVIGLAAWGSGSDAGIIPAETVNRFLNQAAQSSYAGFGAMGFETYQLLDPAMRRFLKLPPEVQHGVYVSGVFTLGTGSTQLKRGDVICSIDGHKINAYSRYRHPQYDLISFDHLILQASAGQKIAFEIYRDGKPLTLEIPAEPVAAAKMLIPYYMYGQQPVYYVTGGYVFQQLTRDYLTMWGDGWPGKVPPHLFNYYFTESFKPKPDRQEIIVLSYVLPAEINLGYQQLARLVVSTVNGKKPASVKEFVQILEAPNESPFITVTFELEAPTLVIPKAGLSQVNAEIAQLYGITKPQNLNHE